MCHLSVTCVCCVRTTELVIKQLALDCCLETLVYIHQMWKIYSDILVLKIIIVLVFI